MTRTGWAPVLALLAQGSLLLVSALLGSGLSMQAAVTAARATQARAEQQVVVADSGLDQAKARQRELEEAAAVTRTEAEREAQGIADPGNSGLPGIGPLALSREQEAQDLQHAADQQRAAVQRLLESETAQAQTQAAAAAAEATRARVAAKDQERVAWRSIVYAGALAVLTVVLLVSAHLLRTRQLRTDAANVASWRAELARALDRLDARLNVQYRTLVALRSTSFRRRRPR